MANFTYQNIVFLSFLNLSFNKFKEILQKCQRQTKIIDEFANENKNMIANYSNEKIKHITDDITAEKTKKIMDYAKSLSFNFDREINLKNLSDFVEQKLYTIIDNSFKKLINTIDTSATYRLFIIAVSKYLIENYDSSINILLNLQKLYQNENTELNQKLNYYLDLSINIENKNKNLEESKNSYYNENIKLKKKIDSLNKEKISVDKKIIELSDKIEELKKSQRIINEKLKDNEKNFQECQKEKKKLLESNDNLKKKNIISKWDLFSQKIISLDYKKNNENLLNTILEVNKVVFDHDEIDREMLIKINNLEKEISKYKIELKNTKLNEKLQNTKMSALKLDNESLKIKFEIEKGEFLKKINEEKKKREEFEKQINKEKKKREELEKEINEEKKKREELEKELPNLIQKEVAKNLASKNKKDE